MKYADESALYHKHFILAQILAHNSYLPAHGFFYFLCIFYSQLTNHCLYGLYELYTHYLIPF